MEIEGLRAVFPDIIKQSAPLVQTTLKKLFRIIEGAEEKRVKQSKLEAKIRVGDRVEEHISRKSGIVLGLEGDIVVVGIPYDKEKHYWHIDSVELVEPTEQTEAEKKPNIGSIKSPWKLTSRTAIGTHMPPTSQKM